MKVLLTNLDVKSGIGYVGDKIFKWLEILEVHGGIPIEVTEYKKQTCVSVFTNDIIAFKPDLIIVNEYFPRIIEPLYYYKTYNPKVRILFICHSYKTLIETTYNDNNYIVDQMIQIFVKDTCDKIICLSKNLVGDKYRYGVDRKIIELYMPVNSKEYKIITPWINRKKLFGHWGMGDNRLSNEFVEKIKDTNLYVDCYGEDNRESKLRNVPNLLINPRVKQEDMPASLNEYKFFVLPHVGSEVFFITLLQSIMTGTIPLVTNSGDSNWLKWAEGLFFEADSINALISNMGKISQEQPDFLNISERISRVAAEQFNENIIKKEVLDFLV